MAILGENVSQGETISLQTFPKYEENGRKQSKSLWSRKRMRNFALRNVEVSLLKTKP